MQGNGAISAYRSAALLKLPKPRNYDQLHQLCLCLRADGPRPRHLELRPSWVKCRYVPRWAVDESRRMSCSVRHIPSRESDRCQVDYRQQPTFQPAPRPYFHLHEDGISGPLESSSRARRRR